jgi:hypothetical protein
MASIKISDLRSCGSNLFRDVAQLVNPITTQEMPDVLAELEELDEEGLSQVWGGKAPPLPKPFKWRIYDRWGY